MPPTPNSTTALLKGERHGQQLWLIRHGETTWSRTGQHTGRADIPLLPKGEAQAAALAPLVGSHRFEIVLTSPLQRAQQTAKLVGFSHAILDSDLAEWDYGAYEGKTLKEIRQQANGWTIWTGAVPGGETIGEVATRARRVLARIRSETGDAVVIGHGHMLRVLATCWLDLSPIEAQHLALSTASINILGFENEIPVILEWNWRPTRFE